MKKLIHCAVAVAALTVSAGALASAECNAGSAWGVNPGCGSSNHTHQVSPYGGWVDTTRVLPTTPYGPHGVYNTVPQIIVNGMVLPQVVANGMVLPQAATPYRPTRRDRDGDGIRNRHDRYPDDPRWR